MPAGRALSTGESMLAEQVIAIRHWQHVLNEQLKKKAFAVPIHLAFGHEAISVAVSAAMKDDDQIVLTHRNVSYNLARAGSLKDILHEYRMEPSGVAGGNLGSMNLANVDHGVVYSSSILGNNISVACGLALANQLHGKEALVTVLTGDGAMEEGQFYEGLVFAKTHHLNVLFIVENNDQSMASTIAERRIPIYVEKLTSAMGIPFMSLTGNDVFEYAKTLAEARRQVLALPTPVCLEVELAALYQHAGPTPGWPDDPKNISIDRGLVVEETERDPVHILRQRLGNELFDRLSADVTSRPVEG